MANLRTYVTDASGGTLTSALAPSVTTVDVDTSGFPAVPFYAVIDPGNDKLLARHRHR